MTKKKKEVRIYIVKAVTTRPHIVKESIHTITFPIPGDRKAVFGIPAPRRYGTIDVPIHQIGNKHIGLLIVSGEPDTASLLENHFNAALEWLSRSNARREELALENQELKKENERLQALISNILEIESLHGGFSDD